MKLKVVIAVSLLGIVLLKVNAKELFPESVFPQGSVVEVGDTLAGYPVHADGPGWIYTGIQVSSATGGTTPIKLPTVYRAKWDNGLLTFAAATTVNVGQGQSSGWNGDPCGGDNIIKINVVRGSLDRCAVMRFIEVPIDGVNTPVLQAEAIETNTNGRYYEHMIFAVIGNLGLSSDSFLKDTTFEPKAMAWLQQFLNATINAADYNKPAWAFSAIPSFEDLITSTTTSVKPETKSDINPKLESKNTPSEPSKANP